MNTYKVAKIVCEWASDNPLLIDALADNFEVESSCSCRYTWEGMTTHQYGCPAINPFDRDKFLSIAKGK